MQITGAGLGCETQFPRCGFKTVSRGSHRRCLSCEWHDQKVVLLED